MDTGTARGEHMYVDYDDNEGDIDDDDNDDEEKLHHQTKKSVNNDATITAMSNDG